MMRSRLSPTVWRWITSMPPSASAPPSTPRWCRRSARAAARSPRPRSRSASHPPRDPPADPGLAPPPSPPRRRPATGAGAVVARLPSIRYWAPVARVRATASHSVVDTIHAAFSATGGSRAPADGHLLHHGLHLGPERGRHRQAPPAPVGPEPRDGRSRAVISRTGNHQKPSAATIAHMAPRTSALSASGSRNAPDRVVPSAGPPTRRVRRWPPGGSTGRAPGTTGRRRDDQRPAAASSSRPIVIALAWRGATGRRRRNRGLDVRTSPRTAKPHVYLRMRRRDVNDGAPLSAPRRRARSQTQAPSRSGPAAPTTCTLAISPTGRCSGT